MPAWLGTIARSICLPWGNAEALPMGNIRIRVVIFREGTWWCAQCLEFDIAAQAETKEDLKAELHQILMTHVEFDRQSGRKPFDGLKPAPRLFFDLFEKSKSPVDEKTFLLGDAGPSIVPSLKMVDSPSPVSTARTA
jgi:predicted RNase H-like HicB family nuclease